MFGESYLESNFIKNFGSFSRQYPCVGELGSPSFKVNLHMVLSIVSFIFTILLLILSTPKKDKYNGKRPPRSTTQSILLVFAIIFLLGTLGNLGYYFYLYITCYLPQKKIWFNKLPQKARLEISQINVNQENQARLRNLERRQNRMEFDNFARDLDM